MRVSRAVLPAVSCVLLSLVTLKVSGRAAADTPPATPTVCAVSDPGASFSIDMTAAGGEATYPLKDPIPSGATGIRVSWLTEQLLMQPNASAPVEPKPLPFALGYCGPDPHNKAQPLTQYLAPGSDLSALAGADAIVILFVPNEPGRVTRYLKLEWTDSASKPQTMSYKVTGNGGIPDYAKYSRYKLWAYMGYTYLRSQNDKDSFAELLLRTETRWVDERIALKQHHHSRYDQAVRTGELCDADNKNCGSAKFGIVRIYGEAGLTGTIAVATGGSLKQTEIGTTQAFGGNIGLGFGYTRLVSSLRSTDTSAVSVLFVPRLAITSHPAATGANSNSAFTSFDYSANIRIENEPSLDDKVQAGNFEGAYSEFGLGESEQFSRKKVLRLRYDGLLPIPSGSDLLRFALRLQIDAPRPFANKNGTPDNLSNETRLSALFNIDLLALGKRISGTK